MIDVGVMAANRRAAIFTTPCQAMCQIEQAWKGSKLVSICI